MLGFKRLVTRRIATVAVVASAFVLVSTSLTLANSYREYGEMTGYSLVFPVDGTVTLHDTFYAARSNGDHHAQDLMAPKMTPVVAAASGTIRYVNWSSNPDDLNPERCCTLAIRHDDGWESWYIHLNNDTPGTDDGQAWGIVAGIVPGSRVEAGQHIGWVGDSGNAENTGSHLHFELRDPAGVIVNPYNALLAACGAACTQAGTVDAPPPPTATVNDTLSLGSRGSVVSDLQSTLASLRFDPGPIDGIFGGMTLSAVERFQSARGLTVDGLVGPATKAALASAEPTSDGGSSTTDVSTVASSDSGSAGSAAVVAYGARGSTVVDLQSMLSKLGHAPGPIDGDFGPLTQGAVKRFQGASNLSASGTVDQTTWDALLVAAGSGDAPAIVVHYGTVGENVLALQEKLSALGHAPGPIDGIFGPKTRNAVVGYQSASGIGSDGVVDQATWDALQAA